MILVAALVIGQTAPTANASTGKDAKSAEEPKTKQERKDSKEKKTEAENGAETSKKKPAENSKASKPKKGAKATPYPLDTCIVTDNKLGSMGDPIAKVYEGQEIKVCCKPCLAVFDKDPVKYMEKLKEAS